MAHEQIWDNALQKSNIAGHVSDGEVTDIRGMLPQELLELWPEKAGV